MSSEGAELKLQMNQLVNKNGISKNASPDRKSNEAFGNGKSHHPFAGGAGRMKVRLRHIPIERWQRIELVILAAVVVIVWGLLSLPVIFYHLPENKISNSDEIGKESGMGNVSNSTYMFISGSGSGNGYLTSGSGNQSNAVCLTKYTGTHCLQPLRNCLPGEQNTPEIFVSNLIDDQSALEDDIDNLLYFLDLLIRPSDECRRRVVPFLCLYQFGLCDENGLDYRPKAAECSDIRDKICETEWQQANSLLASIGMPTLPDCSTFSDDGLVCSSNNSTEVCTITCHDQFYCENNFCKPRCDRFREYSEAYVIVSDTLVILSACVGLLAGSVVLMISCYRRKRMLTFPTVLLFYLTIALVVFGSTVLISYMDRSSLHCSSIDLVKTIEDPTVFCKIGGGVFYYVLLQASLWWIFHVSALFWKVQFPLHSRSFETAHRTKYIHMIMVVLALLIPLIPVITSEVKGGYTMTRFPTILCTGSDKDVTFYTMVLPITIILVIGTSILVFIFWKIHTQQGLFRSRMMKTPIAIGAAERKILIVFLYYITLGVFALTAFTLSTKKLDENIVETLDYFECQKNGHNNTCSYDPQQYPTVTLISYLLLGLFPAINLVFAVNIQEVKALVKHLNKRLLKKTPTSTVEDKSESTAVSTVSGR